MRLLVWHWGRFGAGPRYAAALARALGAQPGIETLLSLPGNAEILATADAPVNDLPVRTYGSLAGFVLRVTLVPFLLRGLVRRLRGLQPDAAVCAMPAMLDLLMIAALRLAGIAIVIVVHDAAPHPGERVPMQHRLQRRALRSARVIVALSTHVADQLRDQGWRQPIVLSSLPPLDYGALPTPARHGGKLRLLCFGRLLPYKGLDLLAASWPLLGAAAGYELRVVGRGPESQELAALRALPGVRVENRWVPEAEMPSLLGWCDAVVLPYREASQSGVAAAALAAGRAVVATRVGGLAEQLADEQRAVLCDPDPAALAAALRRLPDLLAGMAAAPDPGAAWRHMAASLAPDLAAHLERGA